MDNYDFQCLEYEYKNLKDAIENIYRAITDLKDVDNTDEEYKQLDMIVQDLEDKLSDLDIKITDEKEERENEELRPSWEKEKRQQILEDNKGRL